MKFIKSTLVTLIGVVFVASFDIMPMWLYGGIAIVSIGWEWQKYLEAREEAFQRRAVEDRVCVGASLTDVER